NNLTTFPDLQPLKSLRLLSVSYNHIPTFTPFLSDRSKKTLKVLCLDHNPLVEGLGVGYRVDVLKGLGLEGLEYLDGEEVGVVERRLAGLEELEEEEKEGGKEVVVEEEEEEGLGGTVKGILARSRGRQAEMPQEISSQLDRFKDLLAEYKTGR
ncbi:hypothetical protein HDV05_002780, partial [Chytridiales sp. JEL 0842]